MQVVRGTRRVVLVFDGFVIKLPRLLHAFLLATRKSALKYPIGYEIKELVRMMIYPMRLSWSEFVFYQKTRHIFCAKTYFSFFGFFNIQERIIHLKGGDPKDLFFSRKEEYDFILNYVFIGRKQDVDGHTFCNPVNFGFSKKTHEFVCLDYSESMAQSNILEFGEKLQNAFRDFDKK